MRVIHWFRNDLRLQDNSGLTAAATRGSQLVPLFVLDPRLLQRAGPPRTAFLLDCLRRLDADLRQRGSALIVRRGEPATEIARLAGETGAELVTFNRDYSPYATRRDARVATALRRAGVAVADCKDRVICESTELRTSSAGAYVVYTPYRRRWFERLRQFDLEPAKALRLPPPLPGVASDALPSPPPHPGLPTAGEVAGRRRLRAFLDQEAAAYDRRRDLVGADATSHLSPYLRFGAISVRECVRLALERKRGDRAAAAGVGKWIDQLVWRDFYAGIVAEHPHALTGALRREFDAVEWNDDDTGFGAWCEGRSGYPIVDAGMRQLVQTGWMHNRARMIAASFLVKDLLVNWQRGEAFFMKHLVDGDPANNNGGWQWCASTGTDAQPYFRVFNPTVQGERFDPRGEYVRRFVPELEQVPDRWIHRPWQAPSPPRDYPPPIVDHAERRALAVARFQAARVAAGKDQP
jgi:deoxyribodipyrimidine photo-lyase